MHGEAGNVLAVKNNVAGIAAHQADDHVKGGGFSSAVGSKESDDVAALNG
jgi:hypothetical protein